MEQSNCVSVSAPCIASSAAGTPCGQLYIQHGPLAARSRALVSVTNTPLVFTQPTVSTPLQTSTAWTPPTNTVHQSANASRVAHFTAARAQVQRVPGGAFNNSSTPRRSSRGRSRAASGTPRGFTPVTPALSMVTENPTMVTLHIFFLPYAVSHFI